MRLLLPDDFVMFPLFLRMYWKALFCVTWPVVLLPIYVSDIRPQTACCYVALLMGGYWILDVLPLAVTAFIPMVLFPAMDILPSEETARNYFHDANMLFFSGFMIAIAVEYSHLHIRLSLISVKMLGYSPRKLLVGFVAATMFVSMWLSNTAATVMMMPIVEFFLRNMEELGFCKTWASETVFFINRESSAVSTSTMEADIKNKNKVPTKINVCYHIAIAYAASIGGMSTFIGTVGNLAMKGIYEQTFPDAVTISFTDWMFVCLPMTVVMTALVTLVLEIYYLGLFRPNSAAAKAIYIDEEGKQVAKDIMNQKLYDLGPWSFHEVMVGILFILVVMLWFFRQGPGKYKGWSGFLDLDVKDATPAMLVVVLMFLIPAKPSCLYTCSADFSERPTEPTGGLLSWKIVQTELPWGLVFLMGGGFALGQGSRVTGMCVEHAKYLRGIHIVPTYLMVIVLTIATTILTQFASNCAIANLLLPTLAEIAKEGDSHPLFLMLPVTLATSFSFCLSISTPPNTIAAVNSNIEEKEMAKIGVIVCVICLLVLNIMFPFLGNAVFGF